VQESKLRIKKSGTGLMMGPYPKRYEFDFVLSQFRLRTFTISTTYFHNFDYVLSQFRLRTFTISTAWFHNFDYVLSQFRLRTFTISTTYLHNFDYVRSQFQLRTFPISTTSFDDFQNSANRKVGNEAQTAADEAQLFGDIADALAKKTPNPALARLFKTGAVDMERAVPKFVSDVNNDYIRDPDKPTSQGKVRDGTRDFDDIVDRLLGELDLDPISERDLRTDSALPTRPTFDGSLFY